MVLAERDGVSVICCRKVSKKTAKNLEWPFSCKEYYQKLSHRVRTMPKDTF